MIKTGLQRGYAWYEETGHQLMDPASLTTVEEQRQRLEDLAEDFWQQGEPIMTKSQEGLKLKGRILFSTYSNKGKWVVCVHDYRLNRKRDYVLYREKVCRKRL